MTLSLMYTHGITIFGQNIEIYLELRVTVQSVCWNTGIRKDTLQLELLNGKLCLYNECDFFKHSNGANSK